jgi:hypothetical protein
VQAEVAAELLRAAPEPARREQQRRVDRAGGHYDRAGLDGQPPARRARLDGGRAVAAHQDPLHARARACERARGARGRQVRVAGVLLRSRRAAERAHAAALAPAGVAAQVAAGPAEPLRAPAGERGVGAGQRRRDLGDAERALDAVEDGGERLRRELVEAVFVAPALEHPVGRAEAGAGVHERRAADAAAERQHDRRAPERRDLPAVAVQPRQHVARAPGERVGGVPPALLEHDHAGAALGELLRHDRAAGAGADDDDVGAQRSGGVVEEPAGRRLRAVDPHRPRAAPPHLAHARLRVVAERCHHAGVAVVAHDGRGPQRLGELRYEREPRALQPAQDCEPARAIERPEAAPAGEPLEREQRAAEREPVALGRGGEPRVEGDRGIRRGDRRQRRLRRRRRVGERREDRGLAPGDDREPRAGRRLAGRTGAAPHPSASSSRSSCARASAAISARARSASRSSIAAATAS